jgi:hypothetical protein
VLGGADAGAPEKQEVKKEPAKKKKAG